MEPNLANEYYKEEQKRNRKERPVAYWIILGIIAVAVMIVFALV